MPRRLAVGDTADRAVCGTLLHPPQRDHSTRTTRGARISGEGGGRPYLQARVARRTEKSSSRNSLSFSWRAQDRICAGSLQRWRPSSRSKSVSVNGPPSGRRSSKQRQHPERRSQRSAAGDLRTHRRRQAARRHDPADPAAGVGQLPQVCDERNCDGRPRWNHDPHVEAAVWLGDGLSRARNVPALNRAPQVPASPCSRTHRHRRAAKR